MTLRDLSVYTAEHKHNPFIFKTSKIRFFSPFFRISPNSSKSSSNHAIEQVSVAYSTSLFFYLLKFLIFLKKLDIFMFLTHLNCACTWTEGCGQDNYFFHPTCFSRALHKTKNTPGQDYVIRTRLLEISGKQILDTFEI